MYVPHLSHILLFVPPSLNIFLFPFLFAIPLLLILVLLLSNESIVVFLFSSFFKTV